MNHNKSLLVANWKMHKTIDFAKSFVDELKSYDIDYDGLVICPPFTILQSIKESSFSLAAQDCSALSVDEGSFTGDISAMMLKAAGCGYVIIGHSERRKYHLESASQIKAKMANAHTAGLISILCIGENLEQREEGSYLKFLLKDLEECLASTATEDNVIIAYEPVWAIGSGKAATTEQIEEVHEFISTKGFKILYGGSVNIQNAKEILSTKHVSGVLIGAVSLDAKKLSEIIKIREELCN